MLLPRLDKHTYIFYTSTSGLTDNISPIGTFLEREGMTYIIKKEDAELNDISFTQDWALISLDFQSDLAMVGLTASISTALSSENIPCNVVAAFYHDHLFVPVRMAKRAVKIISKIKI